MLSEENVVALMFLFVVKNKLRNIDKNITKKNHICLCRQKYFKKNQLFLYKYNI